MNPYRVNRPVRRRVVVLFDPEDLERLDRRGMQERMPSRAETVRRLVRLALDEKGPAEVAASPSHDLNPTLSRNEADDERE